MEEENIKLSVIETKLLVRCRLDLEDEFVSGRKKKSVLWGKVLAMMKTDAPDLSPTRDELRRKFLNMVATYRRIKKRNKSTERDATTWEYFNELDEVYGSRHSISLPSQNLQSSLDIPSKQSIEDDGEVQECPGDNHFEIDSDGETAHSSRNNEKENDRNVRNKKRKIPANELLEFFKKEAIEEKRRHNDVMVLEKEKLKIEKKSVQNDGAQRSFG